MTTKAVEYMPRQHRASHCVAGNRGYYPHNGAMRYLASAELAELAVEADPEWTHIVRDAGAVDFERVDMLTALEELS